MRDKELFTLLRTIIIDGFTVLNITGLEEIDVQKMYQPKQEGVRTKPTIYMHKLPEHLYGTAERIDALNEDEDEFNSSFAQMYESPFQINALLKEVPGKTSLTASDVVNYAAYILQSDKALEAFQKAGVGIERITAVRNTPFTDDHGQFEFIPSFDIVLTHQQIITSTTEIVTATELQISRV